MSTIIFTEWLSIFFLDFQEHDPESLEPFEYRLIFTEAGWGVKMETMNENGLNIQLLLCIFKMLAFQ